MSYCLHPVHITKHQKEAGFFLLAAQRNRPSTLSGLGSRSHSTPLPQSRERITDRLDSRVTHTAGQDLGEKERRQRLSTVPPPSRRKDRRSRAVEAGLSEARHLSTEPAPPTERGAPRYARRLSTKPSTPPRESVGYYSLGEEELHEVYIPRAPKVPELDLEEVSSSEPESSARATSLPPPPQSSRFNTIPTPAPSGVQARPSSRPTSAPPTVSSFDYEAMPRSPSVSPPRVYFSPHVRRQANEWAETGSLSLPGCSSPRHARALQRALLLALLTEPGWGALPQGLQQRAGWLFCEGWESSAGHGHAFREVDDLATVLSLEASPDSRGLLSLAVAAVIPSGAQSKRNTERPPASVRSDRP